jgi:methyl-accepting chemotaxis protein
MLKNMSIGKRLAIGFGLVVLFLITVGVNGYWGLEAITQETLKVLNGDAKIVTLSARAKATTLELRRFEKDTELNMGDVQVRNDYASKWRAQQQKLHDVLGELDKFQLLPEGKQAVQSMRDDLATYEGGYSKVLGLIEQGKLHTPQECNLAITEYKDPIHRLEDLATELSCRSVGAAGDGNRQDINSQDEHFFGGGHLRQHYYYPGHLTRDHQAHRRSRQYR